MVVPAVTPGIRVAAWAFCVTLNIKPKVAVDKTRVLIANSIGSSP
jgi:hypothetical protein